jgi:hypothetical protein
LTIFSLRRSKAEDSGPSHTSNVVFVLFSRMLHSELLPMSTLAGMNAVMIIHIDWDSQISSPIRNGNQVIVENSVLRFVDVHGFHVDVLPDLKKFFKL